MCQTDHAAPYTALEFYSGIGGMHWALQQAFPEAQVLAAFDINEIANDVFQHNFGFRPRQGNIEKVGVRRLDKYGADIWMMSPPCQPFTRQGHQRDTGDTRTRSFLRLLSDLAALTRPPTWLLLENVVGFEASQTRDQLLEVLAGQGYSWQEFQLSPQQYGLPYSRPRYFCVASRAPGGLRVPLPGLSSPCCCPPYRLLQLAAEGSPLEVMLQQAAAPTGLLPVQPLGNLLQQDLSAEAAVLAKLPPASHHAAAMQAAASRKAALQQQAAPHLPASVRSQQQQQQQQQEEEEEEEPQQSTQPPQQQDLESQQQQQHRQELGGQQQGSTGGCCQEPASTLTCTAPPSAATQAPGPAISAAGAAAAADAPAAAAVDDALSSFLVPRRVLEDCADVLDIVTGDSSRAMCVTKGYSVYTKGTGSVVATLPLDAPGVDPGWYLWEGVNCLHKGFTGVGTKTDPLTNAAVRLVLADAMETLRPRYLTPREVANLHSFPAAFTFPPSVTRRQRYQLLGNSLSVAVVADLLAYLVGGGSGPQPAPTPQPPPAAAAAAAQTHAAGLEQLQA